MSGEVDHKERAHSSLGASGADRWFNCPGSVAFLENIPNSESVHSATGTAAHELADTALQEGKVSCLHEVGNTKSIGGFSIKVDREMTDAVDEYLRYCWGLFRENKGCDMQVEERFQLPDDIGPNMFGTNDCNIYNPVTKTLHVVDYKHGVGVEVKVAENKQLMYYGLGAFLTYSGRGVSKIVLHVVQPRCHMSDESARSWEMDPFDLLTFRAELKEAAARTRAVDAPLVPGWWCRKSFCDARPTCPKLYRKAIETAIEAFPEIDDAVFMSNDAAKTNLPMVDLDELSPEEFGHRLKQADQLETWVKALREEGERRANVGQKPVGFKLINKQARRKFTVCDTEVCRAVSMLSDTIGDLPEIDDDLMYTKKLVSPAQLEKIVGKKQFANHFSDIVDSKCSGTRLVADDHPGEEVNPAAIFEDVTIPGT